MKSLLRPAAVVSSLTIFATYVYLQGSGRSLTELWSPATAEAGAPLPTSVSPDNGPTFVYREPGMPATKSMPLPIDVRPASSVASGGYSSGIVPRAASAPPWLPTPASNPVPARFPDSSAMKMLAGSKSLPMPVQVQVATPATIAPQQPVTVQQRTGSIMYGSKSAVMPVTIAPQSSQGTIQHGYAPQQSAAPQFSLFQGVPASVPAGERSSAPNGSSVNPFAAPTGAVQQRSTNQATNPFGS
jgi:hypothetical protein